jgi:hypothetical protein
MPDCELIHSSSDVTSVLSYALQSGFLVRIDAPQREANVRLVGPSEAGEMQRGVFFLYRPEWIFGPFQFFPVPAGENAGKYFVSPSANCSPIKFYFSGERLDNGRRRFGACAVSYDRDWLELASRTTRRASPDVGKWFRHLVRHISSGVVIKGGKHNYGICRGVLLDPHLNRSLPPFDFVPWPPPHPG